LPLPSRHQNRRQTTENDTKTTEKSTQTTLLHQETLPAI
jgi:hypothetical protein